LRGGVGSLLAFVRGLPLVTLLPQVILATPQIGNDLPQFGHQHIGRCVAFYLRPLSRFGRSGQCQRREDAEQLARVNRPLPEVVAGRRDAAGFDGTQNRRLSAAGRLRRGAESECRHGCEPFQMAVRGMVRSNG
jgi:hypothetical protein